MTESVIDWRIDGLIGRFCDSLTQSQKHGRRRPVYLLQTICMLDLDSYASNFPDGRTRGRYRKVRLGVSEKKPSQQTWAKPIVQLRQSRGITILMDSQRRAQMPKDKESKNCPGKGKGNVRNGKGEMDQIRQSNLQRQTAKRRRLQKR